MTVLNSFESTHALLLAEPGWVAFTSSRCSEALSLPPSRSQTKLNLLSTKHRVSDDLAFSRGVPQKVEDEVDVVVPNKAATSYQKRLGSVSGKF